MSMAHGPERTTTRAYTRLMGYGGAGVRPSTVRRLIDSREAVVDFYDADEQWRWDQYDEPNFGPAWPCWCGICDPHQG